MLTDQKEEQVKQRAIRHCHGRLRREGLPEIPAEVLMWQDFNQPYNSGHWVVAVYACEGAWRYPLGVLRYSEYVDRLVRDKAQLDRERADWADLERYRTILDILGWTDSEERGKQLKVVG